MLNVSTFYFREKYEFEIFQHSFVWIGHKLADLITALTIFIRNYNYSAVYSPVNWHFVNFTA